MGTETIVALVLFWSFKIPHVKLNNPLMGTETYLFDRLQH